MKLAVVDDDDDVRTALARLLDAMGHEVTVFSSAEEFEAAPLLADCLIVDVRLPGQSGVDLRDKLRSSNAPLPIVFITGSVDRLDRDARTDGTPIVTNPFDFASLTAAMTDAITAARTAGNGHAV